MMRWSVTMATVLAVMAGCGGDDGGGGGGGDPTDTGLGGIYVLTAWTRNEGGCASEGTSILASESRKHVYVKPGSFFGVGLIELVPCTTLDECRIEAADDTVTISEFGSVSEGSDSAGWTGGRIAAGGSGGTCNGTLTSTTLAADGPMKILIRAEQRPTGDFPADSDGFCTTEDAEAAAADMPCEELDVLRGDFVEALP